MGTFQSLNLKKLFTVNMINGFLYVHVVLLLETQNNLAQGLNHPYHQSKTKGHSMHTLEPGSDI